MEKIYKQISLKVADKTINIYTTRQGSLPAVYFNTFDENADENLLNVLYSVGAPPITLVIIAGIDWNKDMSPWYAPPAFKNDVPCEGGADRYLTLLTQKIIPESEKHIGAVPLWRGLAGYSLSGLFALYALYKTPIFSRVACMSASFWFPDFTEFVKTHTMQKLPECVYFSLGDKEAKTKNPIISTVLKNTQDIYDYYRKLGVPAAFKINPGGHFDNAIARCAAGINYIAKYPHNTEE